MYKEEKILIPEELDQVVTDSLKRVERIRQRQVLHNIMISITSTAAAVLILLIWGFANPAIASKIPVIGGIFLKVENRVSYSGNYHKRAVKLEPEGNGIIADSDQGVIFTASEVYCDGYSLYLTLEIKSDFSLGEIAETDTDSYGVTQTKQITIAEGNASFEGMDSINLSTAMIQGTQVDENTFQGMLKLALPQQYKSQEIISLNIYQMYYQDNNLPDSGAANAMIRRIVGNWQLEIPVVVDTNDVREYVVDKQENGCTIRKVMISEYEIQIIYTVQQLYDKKEAVLAEKRRLFEENKSIWSEAGEDISGWTEQDIDSHISIARTKDQGVALFDQDGKRIPIGGLTSAEEGMQDVFCASYPIKGNTYQKLHIYVADDAISTAKESDEETIRDRALLEVTLDME